MKFPQVSLLRVCLLFCSWLLASCSGITFYSQALKGQREIFQKARPVAEVKADPKTHPFLKHRLEVVADMLTFADKNLHLPARGQYERYTNLKRPYVVWVVYAAPELSVEGKTWWYPIIGRLKYRGFFEGKLAEAEAARLRKQGLDVFIGEVSAFSTLGYFRDPLLNTFLGRREPDLAELIFHELTHQHLYLKGDTDFNEAFATCVGREGAQRWLATRGKKKELAQYLRDRETDKEFVDHALKTREELRRIYADPHLSMEAKRQAKAAAIERLHQTLTAMNRRHGGQLQVEKWFSKPVNNARLSTMSAYYSLLPTFNALLAKHQGRIDPFFRDVESLRGLTPAERAKRLHELAGDAAAQQ